MALVPRIRRIDHSETVGTDMASPRNIKLGVAAVLSGGVHKTIARGTLVVMGDL